MRMRKPSRTTRRNIKNVNLSTFGDIPPELITEIFAQVGATSLTDLFNVKLSCKNFKELGEDKFVCQRVSLEKIPIVSWGPLSEKQQAFLRRCEECKNPELMYRQAVVNFFGKRNSKSAYTYLENAVESGHIEALYLTAIFLLLSDDDKSIDSGIKLLGCMTKFKYWRRKFRRCRNNLIKMLATIWVDYPYSRERPKCCQLEDYHGTKFDWNGEISTQCEACNADSELQFIRSCLPQP